MVCELSKGNRVTMFKCDLLFLKKFFCFQFGTLLPLPPSAMPGVTEHRISLLHCLQKIHLPICQRGRGHPFPKVASQGIWGSFFPWMIFQPRLYWLSEVPMTPVSKHFQVFLIHRTFSMASL